MTKIRITKEFRFEMAHALLNYDGLCSNIHGHSYLLSVTVIGKIIRDELNPKDGMVIDYGQIKDITNNFVISRLDHALLINKSTTGTELYKNNKLFEKVIFTNFQPTCENILNDIASILKEKLPENIQLYCLKLRETPTSYAEWYMTDNV